ncbi:MAG: exodeoxyribonuclease V subunit gamma [Planctomycetia bacterium]
MALKIACVEQLADVLAHASAFLSRDDDLFARPRIVVPNAGTKAWLHDRLARELGTSGPGRGDGIVANIEILYPGAIASLLQPPPDPRRPDAWSLDQLTFAVLEVITSTDAAHLGIPFPVHEEPLLAARRIAGLFDSYHVRRPGMILEWERGKGNPVLAPTANDVQHDGHPVPASLRESDLWQFKVWRAVRALVDAPSPPARRSVAHQPSRERLLVAGLEALGLPQLECLEALGAVCEVEALFVHPSPGLRAASTAAGQQPLPTDLRDRPLQKLRDPALPSEVDPLLPVWLSAARELQDLLAARATPIAELLPPDPTDRPDSLLVRMQRTVVAGGQAAATEHDPATDRSIVIHRCHSLSRQAEVLHDALLDAFASIPGLQPHDVAIVSPCLEQAVPHLQAVFQRTVVGCDGRGGARPITMPLVVADRGIRETNEAADLLVALLAVPASRASIDDVLAVADHPLVRTAFGITDATVAAWGDFLARTRVRWGLDPAHRARHGLVLADDADVHTWKLGLDRMLLGATMPDAAPRAELGGVVPLADLDPVDLVAIARLGRILDVIRTLDACVAVPRPVAEWCDAIERALVGLCGEECPELGEPLGHLCRLRAAAAGTTAEQAAVPFEDVRRLLAAWLEETAGRQPLFTGAITATSLVPLRGVPFKVICVVGYDDGAVGTAEADGDDLVSRQQLVGDLDPRADERRALLDCLLAAGERLVITCNGRNVKSNKRVPLVTPLAEFVDFAVRHGVTRARFDEPSGIEVEHPRHHLSRRNFAPGGVWPRGVWSHDRVAADVLQMVEGEPGDPSRPADPDPGGSPAAAAPAASTAQPDASVELSRLERLVKDPLSLYLQETLGIDIWRDDEADVPATLPTTLDRRQARDLTLALLHELVADPGVTATWVEAQQRTGALPIGPHARRQVEEIIALATGLKTAAEADGLDLAALTARKLEDAAQVGQHRILGPLGGIHADPARLVIVRAGEAGRDEYGRPLHVAALQLLAARAARIDVEAAIVLGRRDGWRMGKTTKPGARQPAPRPLEPWQARVVKLEDQLMPQAAAAGRLDDIARLALEAVRAPRPAFGKVLSAAAANREREFDAFVAGDFYGRSSECALFGVTPTFADVFGRAPERLAWLDAFTRLLEPTWNARTREYRLA